MGGRIIPGVQVSVIKEALPRQLAPSGVLGLIGFTPRGTSAGSERVGEWGRLVELFGEAAAHSLPEARQALENGVSELVVVPLPESAGARAAVSIPAAKGADTLRIEALAAGPWANGITLEVRESDEVGRLEVLITGRDGELLERHRRLPGEETEALAEALARSRVVKLASGDELLPPPGRYTLSGGEDGSVDDYRSALGRLADEGDVDMVLAAVQDPDDIARRLEIYGAVEAHCAAMSRDCKGRIGFGQLPPGPRPAARASEFSGLQSERFVLSAPHGVVGAVAGMIGSLDYAQSPTFKPVAGVARGLTRLRLEEQRALLRGNIVPVVNERGRGVLVLHGRTTDGDQINVRRIADRAVRTMKMIGDLFIGRMNNADGREALKQKLIEALTQMEKDGALVPSTDGEDPAFRVEVKSSQADFAQGIVRVNMAVRPVRAIDFIYATILVQV